MFTLNLFDRIQVLTELRGSYGGGALMLTCMLCLSMVKDVQQTPLSTLKDKHIDLKRAFREHMRLHGFAPHPSVLLRSAL